MSDAHTGARRNRRSGGIAGWIADLLHPDRRPESGADVRVGVSTLDPEAEVRALRSIGDRMLEIHESMSDTVDDLRDDLAAARGSAAVARRPFRGESLPAHSADVIGEAVALGGSVESLYERLDALWFERQWLDAQIAVAKGEVYLPRQRGTR